MVHRVFIGFACFAISAAAASATLVACDGGGNNTGGSGSGNPSTSTSSGKPGTSTSTGTSSGGMGIKCPANYCMVGMGGYGFSYADGDPPATPTGSSHATLAMGELCLTMGHVMTLPAMPTAADYMNDWGLGIGVNLNQTMGTGDAGGGTPGKFALTGAGVTVSTSGVPMCVGANARVVVDHNGMDYCAPFTEGTMIPWSMFNTTCWSPATGTALMGAPMDATQLKVQFVASKAPACDFMNFCLTAISL
jgi:hypothetical protein